MAAKRFIGTITASDENNAHGIEKGSSSRVEFVHVNVSENMTTAQAAAMYEKNHPGTKITDVVDRGSLSADDYKRMMQEQVGAGEVTREEIAAIEAKAKGQ